MSDRRLRLTALTLAILFTAAFFGCALPSPIPVEDGEAAAASVSQSTGANSSADNSDYAVNVTDMAGNVIQLNAPVSSIVVLDPGDCELLYALGAGSLVTGRTIECDYPDEVNQLPYVTVDGKADPELIAMRAPQVVVLSAEQAQDADLLSALSDAGILPVVTNATDINSLYTAVTLLGALTNHTSEANTLVSGLITSLAELQGKTSQHDETVYLELSPLADGLTTAGGNTFASSLIALMGFHNEFEDQTGTLAITQDQVVGRNPGYIITTTADAPASSTPEETTAPDDASSLDGTTPVTPETGVDEILLRTDWQNVSAVSAKRVYYIDAYLLTRAGSRVVDAATALYSILYEGTQP